jgi:hypothetical protein
MAYWGLLAIVIGFLYGALKKGRQDKGRLLREGLMIGLVVGIVLAVIGLVAGVPLLGVSGFIGAIIAAVVITLLFILGVWLGDLVTGARKSTT